MKARPRLVQQHPQAIDSRVSTRHGCRQQRCHKRRVNNVVHQRARRQRGQIEIERRFDLHGTGIEMARINLLGFLRDAQAMGARNVLVITGKGDSPYSRHTLHGAGHFHAPERAGRLRKLVTEWFHEAEFRSLVAGFQPAHPKHGGGGAYYVRVRRIREER